jgi:hypothetical protein
MNFYFHCLPHVFQMWCFCTSTTLVIGAYIFLLFCSYHWPVFLRIPDLRLTRSSFPVVHNLFKYVLKCISIIRTFFQLSLRSVPFFPVLLRIACIVMLSASSSHSKSKMIYTSTPFMALE